MNAVEIDQEVMRRMAECKSKEDLEDLKKWAKAAKRAAKNSPSMVFITNFILLSGGDSPALPTDEEIQREAHKIVNESPQARIPDGMGFAAGAMAGFVDGAKMAGFMEGAKWMRDQISQKS